MLGVWTICIFCIIFCVNVFPAEADLTDLYEHAEMPEIEIDTINDYDERGKTPLLYAASIGHLETVMNMLKAGADVNKPAQNSTDTAVYYAAELGHDVVVAELIRKGADVDIVSSKGVTALFSAAQAGYTRTVEVLLEAGASVTPTDDSGINPLMIAAMRGKYNVVQKILDKHSEMINDESSDGETALVHGILSGNLETVVALLEGGAELNTVGKKNMTPFHEAAKRDHHEILEVLAVHPDGEVVINGKDKYGRSALELAQDMNHQKSMDVLLMYGADIPKRRSIRMTKDVRKARNNFFKEKEDEKNELTKHKTISLT